MPLTSFYIDQKRLAALQPLIDDYSTATDTEAEFPNNVLSKRTVVWENGTFGKAGDKPAFSVEAEELLLCETVADEAKVVAGNLETGFGSESSDEFLPFFIVANTFDPVLETISPALIESRFRGTLFPAFSITVEPIHEQTDWWEHVLHDIDGSALDYLERWTALRVYFRDNYNFVETAFVSIGMEDEGWASNNPDWPPGTIMAPSVFPRLLLGLTKSGSLIGLLGWCVYT